MIHTFFIENDTTLETEKSSRLHENEQNVNTANHSQKTNEESRQNQKSSKRKKTIYSESQTNKKRKTELKIPDF